ncbi:MAG TPA: RDD family protein [Luteimonas sp.]|nr:RDD family protein [Luteimonas sp.]
MQDPAIIPAPPPNAAMVGRRLLALFYDLWPAAALWLLIATVFTVGFTLSGHGPRENIAPFSGLQMVLWAACWVATGLYATHSWRRGGQTLGMRPWRLRVVACNGAPLSARAAWRRYAVATLSLLAAGLGFWWAWLDRDRLTWHDRAAATRVVRVAKDA